MVIGIFDPLGGLSRDKLLSITYFVGVPNQKNVILCNFSKSVLRVSLTIQRGSLMINPGMNLTGNDGTTNEKILTLM